MKLEQLEHIIRAAAVIADDDELIIIGSQAILGAYPQAPEFVSEMARHHMLPQAELERLVATLQAPVELIELVRARLRGLVQER